MKAFRWPILYLFIALSYFTPVSLAFASVNHHGFNIDENNQQLCTDCHESLLPNSSVHASHPVNISYPPANDMTSFNGSAFIVGRGLRLFNDMVTCLTCHDLTRSFPNHLIIENYGSQLCIACHKM